MNTKLSKEKKKELNKLVDDRSLTPAEMEKARKAINAIVKEIKKAMTTLQGVSVDRVFKGGSWKKGTILREECDVDVVVFINCADFMDFSTKVEQILLQIGNHIMELPNVHMLRDSTYMVTFRYKMALFNVMVAYNTAKSSTENSAKEQRDGCLQILQELDPERSTLHLLSSSFAETAISLLQWRNVESDHVLARAIKLMKYWNKCNFEQDVSHKTQLPGYALEILLAHLYDRHKSHVNAPLLFCYALDILANLDTTRADIILQDFISIQVLITNRPLRIFDPCLGTDIIENFESWRTLICIAKKTLQLLKEDAPMDKVFFFQKQAKTRKTTGHSPDISGEPNNKAVLEKVTSEIKPQTKALVDLTDNVEFSQKIREAFTSTTQHQDDALSQINANVEQITNKLELLSNVLTEHKLVSHIFYHSLLDTTKFPKTQFTCQRHGGIVAQVQVLGDLVIVEGGTEHSTCDLWATPTGLNTWQNSLAKPLFPIKLDFKVGGKENGGEGEGEKVTLSVQEEGMRVQKSNPAKCGRWMAFYSTTKQGLAGLF